MKLGLLVRREAWTLTFRGKVLVVSMALLLPLAVRWGAYPFLAVNRPVRADILLVEGWIPNHLLNQVAAEFKRGHYRSLLVVRSVYDEDAEDKYEGGSREYVSHLLVELGVPQESIGTLLYPGVERDRTYHGALAAKGWFSENGRSVAAFDVVTEGPHARRSWLLFQKAFGNTAEIGIVALKDPRYDPKHWWRTSEGVREVLGEAIAYVYARFFFWG